MANDKEVWLITGAARGLGYELASEVLRRGGSVVAAGRDTDAIATAFREFETGPRLLIAHVDVTSPDSIEHVIRASIARFGRIDKLVNNAGYGLLGAIEEADDDEAEAVFDVNVFGTLRMTRAAMPKLREVSGHVVNISSLGGFAASAGWGIYNATKFAVEGLSEALALEVAPLGVKVTIVEPGSFRTGFLSSASMRNTRRTMAEYSTTAGKTRHMVEARAGQQIGDPVLGAKLILEAVCAVNPPLRLVLGADAIERVQQKLKQVSADLEAWRIPSINTAF
jgi:short-subunit dehydrogenase